MSDTPETDSELHGIKAVCKEEYMLDQMAEFARKLERERDEARKKLDEEMKWHHRTHKELVEAQCKLLDMEYDQLKS